MTNFIQNLPRELLGETFSHLTHPDDLVDCTLVCKDWNETIKTSSISKLIIRNLLPDDPFGVVQCTFVCKDWEETVLFPKMVIKNLLPDALEDRYPYYAKLLGAALLISQHPSNFKIQSKDVDDLSSIAAEFQQMGDSHHHPEYQTRVSDKLNRLPEKIQQNLYADLKNVCKNDIIYDFPGWGQQIFHSSDSRRGLPSYSIKRDVVLAQVDEQKLRAIGQTLMHGSSERSKEKAIIHVSQFSREIKEAIYQQLKQILTAKGLFPNLSGKEAFYNGEIPKLIKGAAINVYINGQLRPASV